MSLCPVLGGEVWSACDVSCRKELSYGGVDCNYYGLSQAVALEFLLMNKLKINKNRRNKQLEKYDKL